MNKLLSSRFCISVFALYCMVFSLPSYSNGALGNYNFSNYGRYEFPKHERTGKPSIINSYGLGRALCKIFKTTDGDLLLHTISSTSSGNEYVDYIIEIKKEDANNTDCGDPGYYEIPKSGLTLLRSSGAFSLTVSNQFLDLNPKFRELNRNFSEKGSLILVDLYKANERIKQKTTPSVSTSIFGLTIGKTTLNEAVDKYGQIKAQKDSITNGMLVVLDHTRIEFDDLLAVVATFDTRDRLVFVTAKIDKGFGDSGALGKEENFPRIYNLLSQKYKLISENIEFGKRKKYANFENGDVSIRLESDLFGPSNLLYFNEFYLQKYLAAKKENRLPEQIQKQEKQKKMESQL